MGFWKIAPGKEGCLWIEQRDNNCIAIGWNEVGNLNKYPNDEAIKRAFEKVFWGEKTTPRQLLEFYRKVQKGHKVIASSGKWIYGVGTINGNYKFNQKLEFKHSKPVVWEFTFWEPLNVEELPLGKKLKNRLRLNRTVLRLTEKEGDTIYKIVSRIKNPFKGLTNWEGMSRAPQTEQEVIVLFSKLSNILKMRIEYLSTGFPDAIVMVKQRGKWIAKKAEFEVLSSDFQSHEHDPKKCDFIICWKDDWKRKPRNLKIIELRKELGKII